MRALRGRWGQDAGAVAVLVAVMVTAFLGLSAIVVDVGYLYDVRRQLQTAADAAALAGCRELIASGDMGSADAVAREYAGRNAAGPGSALEVESVEVTDEYVRVVVDQDSKLFFANIFGKSQVPVRAAAKAQRWRISGGRYLVPWAIPIIRHIDRVEAVLCDMSGGVISVTELGGSGTEWSGSIAAPSGLGVYQVFVRVYNEYGVWEGLVESPDKEVPSGIIGVVDDTQAIMSVTLDRTIVTAESPEPVQVEVRTREPVPGVGIAVDGAKYAMTDLGGGVRWGFTVTGALLGTSEDLITPHEVQVFLESPSKAPEAIIIARRTTHPIAQVSASPAWVGPGGSVGIEVQLHAYDAPMAYGVPYTLRVEGGAGFVGNYAEVNYSQITHAGSCVADPPGIKPGNDYFGWTSEGYAGGVHVGDIVSTSPGSSGAVTSKALEARFAGLPAEDWVVHVPVVEKYEDKGGASDVIVVDFAAFRVTSWDKKGLVSGEFIEHVTIPSGFDPDNTGDDYLLEAPRLVNP